MTKSPIPQPLVEAIAALKECAVSLQAEIDGRYNGTQDKYPDQMRRYQRDIEPVTHARKSLAALEAFAGKDDELQQAIAEHKKRSEELGAMIDTLTNTKPTCPECGIDFPYHQKRCQLTNGNAQIPKQDGGK